MNGRLTDAILEEELNEGDVEAFRISYRSPSSRFAVVDFVWDRTTPSVHRFQTTYFALRVSDFPNTISIFQSCSLYSQLVSEAHYYVFRNEHLNSELSCAPRICVTLIH
jgi:hypothetical protein